MKPFKVNRNSWHYKLNQHFFNERGYNEYYMQDTWERKYNNFCAYWRVTVFRLVTAIAFTAGILSFLFVIGVVAYQHPWDTFVVVGSVVGAILAFVTIGACGMFLSEYFEKRKYQNKEVPDSLFVAKYKSYKSKVCPMVEYDK
jgi:hypothetical protein